MFIFLSLKTIPKLFNNSLENILVAKIAAFWKWSQDEGVNLGKRDLEKSAFLGEFWLSDYISQYVLGLIKS